MKKLKAVPIVNPKRKRKRKASSKRKAAPKKTHRRAARTYVIELALTNNNGVTRIRYVSFFSNGERPSLNVTHDRAKALRFKTERGARSTLAKITRAIRKEAKRGELDGYAITGRVSKT